jgi:hypothetical protein
LQERRPRASDSTAATRVPLTCGLLGRCLPALAVRAQWVSEWKRWVQKHDPSAPQLFQMPASTTGSAVMQTLRIWRHAGGVLIMSHDNFWRLLSPRRASTAAAAAFDTNFVNESPSDLAEVERLLLKPGPDVVVMDGAMPAA